MLHPRAFKVTVVWTLLLLYLGSVVHATESSLACPDWPTCFGTLAPEMTGGVFWEHLHRLVASGLGLMFMLATWLAWRETRDRPWIFHASLAGLLLVIVQGVFGGLTVIWELPDLVSTTHWTLALAFLTLSTVLASGTLPPSRERTEPTAALRLRGYAVATTGLVFAQSVLGALVRHTDAGMACPDVPLCLGQAFPPLVNAPITLHFSHRVLALVTIVAIVVLTRWAKNARVSRPLRGALYIASTLVGVQATLGVLSVTSVLAVVPVSLHSLGAALLTVNLTHVATRAHFDAVSDPVAGAREPEVAAT